MTSRNLIVVAVALINQHLFGSAEISGYGRTSELYLLSVCRRTS
jgi:hypothetical protein